MGVRLVKWECGWSVFFKAFLTASHWFKKDPLG